MIQRIPLVLLLLVCGGCGVESQFSLAHQSPLPLGLRDDAKAAHAAATASRIELYYRTYDPPRLLFYRGSDAVLAREGVHVWFKHAGMSDRWFIRFNGLMSEIEHVAAPNVVRFTDPVDVSAAGASAAEGANH